MGGKSTSTSATKLNQISVQSSALGLPLPRGWGRNRVKPNLFWYGAFQAIAHTTKQSAGKGLDGSSKSTTYTYTASVILGLCEGTIRGIRTIYRDKSVYTDGASVSNTTSYQERSGTYNISFGGGGSNTALAQAGLSLATGGPDQSTWGYLTSRFPTQALNYSGIAYVYAQDYALSDSGSLSNHSFEIDFAVQMSGLADADPRDIVTDFLTNANCGLPGWSAGLIGDLSDYSLYCRANNLLLSPVLDQQVSARDSLTEWMTATNAETFWSEGVLKIRPYGDTAATGNGVTWTPNLTPIYDLTERDFVPVNDQPVAQQISDLSSVYNIVQVEYLDRANQYNTAIASAQAPTDIDLYGTRKGDPVTIHSICDGQIAQHATQLLLQRTLYRGREVYSFQLPWDFILVEPMDYLTLTTMTDELLLDRELVQVVQIEEDTDGLLTFMAEGVDIGAASAALYPPHSADSFLPDFGALPGPVTSAVMINAPATITGGDPQVWVAAASTNPVWGGCEVWISADDVEYRRVGRIEAPARIGVSTAGLPAHADPDAASTLSVNLAASGGELIGTTGPNADAGATLSIIGDELISFETPTLTAAHHYDLTNLRRGLYDTTPANHTIGEEFVRLDDAVFRFGYSSLNVGTTIYIKLPSFNIYGQGLEDISSLGTYNVALSFTELTVEWSLVAGAGKPQDNATDGAVLDPTASHGAIRHADGTPLIPDEVLNTSISLSPDGRLLATIAGVPHVLGTLDASAAAVIGAASDTARRQLDQDLARISEAVTRLAAGQAMATKVFRDAGLYTDPASGTAKLFAIEQRADQLTQLSVALNAQLATINLKASVDYVNSAIIAAGLSPGDAADFSTILVRLTSAETDIDGLNATVMLKADATTVTAISGMVTSVQTSLDALAATVDTKASQTVVDAQGLRITSAEETLSAMDGGSIAQAVSAARAAPGASDAAGAGAITALALGDLATRATFVAIASARQELTAKITSDVAAEAAQRLSLAVQISGVTAGVATETAARIAADTATAATLTAYQATTDGSLATINTGLGAVTTQAAATASSLTSFQTSVNGSIAGINNSLTSQSTSIGALSASLTSLTATVGTNASAAMGAISDEAVARATADSALAGYITTISTTLGGHSATLTAYGSSIDGLLLKYGVEFNSDGQISGFVLNGGGGRTDAVFSVDNFKIAKPGSSTAFAVFDVDDDIFYLNGTLKALSVDTNMLTVGGVTTDRVADGAVSSGVVVNAGTRTVGPTVSTIASGALTPYSTASTLLIIASGIAYIDPDASNGSALSVIIRVNGSTVLSVVVLRGSGKEQSFTLPFVISAPSGAQTVTVQASTNVGPGNPGTIIATALIIQEFKK